MPATTVADLPEDVREVEHIWIPMPDGCRLAARLWLPVGAASAPVPALLEYIPYGKRDGTRERDEAMHRWFAAHGHAVARVDLRGSGESDGVLRDEYLEQEHDDALAVIAWLAAQPWCSGAVGMLGKSWGGFNALQVAALRPPALKAVIAVCAADDRYSDDAHYMGGCLLNENQTWGSVLFTLNALPPDPALVGPGWRATWLERLGHTRPYPLVWLQHQRRDSYWRHGSVCEDFSRIRVPVWAVSGWADGYSNAVPRLLEHLRVPRKGLVGPWGHLYPHDGRPGPAIGFLHEAVRWWDHWLKGIDSGVMDEPTYRAWMPPGRWVAEPGWPSSNIRPWRLQLGAGALQEEVGAGQSRCASAQTLGLAAGSWCAFGYQGELPLDQRVDDAGSCCFDSAPVSAAVELLGAPVLHLRLACDRPSGFVVARLCDLAPDGTSTRISYGVLNLTHRHGHERPEALLPGEPVEVAVVLNDSAWQLAPGHRLRLALSTAYWPLVWPAAQVTTLDIDHAGSHLELPVRPPRPQDAQLPALPPPEVAPVDPVQTLFEAGSGRAQWSDPATRTTHYVNRSFRNAAGEVTLWHTPATGLTTGHGIEELFSIAADDPLSASTSIRHTAIARRGAWATRVETRIVLRADAVAFRLEAGLDAFEGMGADARCVFSRAWAEDVARDGV